MKLNYYIVKFDYKARLDSICINILGNLKKKEESFSVSDNVIIDLDAEKNPVLFRISDVSVIFQEKKNFFKNISQVKIDLKVDSDSITFNGLFQFSIDNEVLEKKLDITIPNEIKMPETLGTYTAGKSF
jgi:hypothetical protein